jgi:tetratricopeptide (TPR) repeat protein
MRRFIALIALVQIALIVAVPVRLFAQSPGDEDRMSGANQLYEGGRYTEAAQAYEQLVDQGLRDSSLYYNLGNAYYKQGDIGRAIVAYLRAEKLAPRDSDVRTNLEVAREQTVDLFDAPADGFLVRLADLARLWSSLNENAVVALLLWFGLTSLLLTRLLGRWDISRRAQPYATALVAALLVIAVLSLGARLYSDSSDRAAVVVADQVDVVSGPGLQYLAEFTLHSGAEADILESRAGWVRLALPGGELQGWVPAAEVEEVGRAR